MKTMINGLIIFSCLFLFVSAAYSHCEVPCGIYDDQMRIKMLREHVITIEKSMKNINSITKEKGHNSNQLIRWITNKENHATDFQHIVTQYFMTQRIKPDAKSYAKKLELLHQMLIYSMKCKQTIDLGYIKKLNAAIDEFESLYFTK